MKAADFNVGALQRLHLGVGKTLPVILQTEAAECGLVCLAMILDYYGHNIDLFSLRQKFAISLKGATLKSLIDVAHAVHLDARAIRLDLDELHCLRLPCIVHWQMRHFVVLKKVVRSRTGVVTAVVVHDPAGGEKRVALSDLTKCFTGVALELTPSSTFTEKNEKRRLSLIELMGSVVGLKRSLAQILTFAVALEIFTLVTPFFMQWVVDGAIVSDDHELLNTLVLSFGLLMVVQCAVALVRSWAVIYMMTHLGVQWLSNVFTHLVQLPGGYFEKRHLGDVISRFGAITSIQKTLTTGFVEAVVDGLMAAATVVMMMIYSLKLTLVVFASLLIYSLLRWASYRPLRRATEQQIVLQAREQTVLMESIRAIQPIKLFNKELDRRSRWQNAVVSTLNRGLATQKLGMVFTTAHTLVAGIENLVVVWLAANLVMANHFSVGMLFAFMSYKGTFTGRVYSLVDKYYQLKLLSIQSERLADIVLTESEEEQHRHQGIGNDELLVERFDSTNGMCENRLNEIDTTIEVSDLAFRYADSEPWVFERTSFRVHPGEFVALVGPSGCGKTTLIKVLVGLLHPNAGEILVGGRSMRSMGIKAYRDIIGTVMQDDQLLAGTIAENISFFDLAPDNSRIRECATLAMIDEEILSMPMGYLTLVGDMGSSLSGGQRQRVLLARAIYKRPRVLFLDEATSHLDVENEARIAAAIRGLDITRIVVAHRPDTIRSANRVIELAKRPSVKGEGVSRREVICVVE